MDAVAADMRATAAQVEAQYNESNFNNGYDSSPANMYGQPYYYPVQKPWFKKKSFLCIGTAFLMFLIVVFVFPTNEVNHQTGINDDSYNENAKSSSLQNNPDAPIIRSPIDPYSYLTPDDEEDDDDAYDDDDYSPFETPEDEDYDDDDDIFEPYQTPKQSPIESPKPGESEDVTPEDEDEIEPSPIETPAIDESNKDEDDDNDDEEKDNDDGNDKDDDDEENQTDDKAEDQSDDSVANSPEELNETDQTEEKQEIDEKIDDDQKEVDDFIERVDSRHNPDVIEEVI